jgi:hypothetical protein
MSVAEVRLDFSFLGVHQTKDCSPLIAFPILLLLLLLLILNHEFFISTSLHALQLTEDSYL